MIECNQKHNLLDSSKNIANASLTFHWITKTRDDPKIFLTFSANLAYFPSSVTKSAEHFFKWANKYFRTNLSTGRITEQANATRDQCLRLTLELGSGWSVVCLINWRNSSFTRQSFFMALSKTVWISNTWSSSSLFGGGSSVKKKDIR